MSRYLHSLLCSFSLLTYHAKCLMQIVLCFTASRLDGCNLFWLFAQKIIFLYARSLTCISTRARWVRIVLCIRPSKISFVTGISFNGLSQRRGSAMPRLYSHQFPFTYHRFHSQFNYLQSIPYRIALALYPDSPNTGRQAAEKLQSVNCIGNIVLLLTKINYVSNYGRGYTW